MSPQPPPVRPSRAGQEAAPDGRRGRRLRPTLLLGVAVVLAACSGSAPTPVPAGSAASGGVAGATAVPPNAPAIDDASPAPDATPAAPDATPTAPRASARFDAPSPSLGMEGLTSDPRLEARIPTLVRGIEINVISLSGAEFMERAPESELGRMIEEVGLRPRDVSVAIGVGRDEVGEIAVAAFRFRGAGQATIRDVFSAQLEQDSGAALQAETVGSRDVLAVDIAGFVPTYLHVTGDVAIVVQANDPALALSAVEALPEA